MIRNKLNNKVYIGKSLNVKRRFVQHKYYLRKEELNKKAINKHLFSSVKKYGISNFEFSIIEEIELAASEEVFKERELFWITYYKSDIREFGYNLRKDSSTQMIVHSDTKRILSQNNMGQNNPNFNNKWNEAQRKNMSEISKNRHKSGKFYNSDWKNKIGKKSSIFWENQENRRKMAAKVKKAKQDVYKFLQYDRNMTLLRVWDSVEEIIKENSSYKWQQIYSVCSGHKPTIYGFIWRKEYKI